VTEETRVVPQERRTKTFPYKNREGTFEEKYRLTPRVRGQLPTTKGKKMRGKDFKMGRTVKKKF